MKKLFILLSAVALTTMVSCQKEPVVQNAEKTNFVVSIGADLTRAVESLYGGGIDPYYEDVTVYLIDGGSNAVGYEWSAAEIAAKTKSFEQIPAPAKVMIIVNKNQAALPIGVTKVSDIKTALNALAIAEQNQAAVTLDAADDKGNPVATYESVQQVTLIGETSTFTDGTNIDNHALKTCSVVLESLVSRFEIGTLKAGTGLESIEIEDVYINNWFETYAKGKSQAYIETTWPLTLGTPVNFTPAWATNEGNGAVTSGTDTKCYAYQVFAGKVPTIIFKVKGTLAENYQLADGSEVAPNRQFTGKYVTITGFTKDGGTTLTADDVAANKIFKVGLTDGGITIDVDKITDKPEKPKYDLNVSITIAAWTAENVTPVI